MDSLPKGHKWKKIFFLLTLKLCINAQHTAAGNEWMWIGLNVLMLSQENQAVHNNNNFICMYDYNVV